MNEKAPERLHTVKEAPAQVANHKLGVLNDNLFRRYKRRQEEGIRRLGMQIHAGSVLGCVLGVYVYPAEPEAAQALDRLSMRIRVSKVWCRSNLSVSHSNQIGEGKNI